MANILSFIALIAAITIHEFSHAFVADRLGDPTPRANGRVSLNPLAHLDPLGTIMMFFVNFGWGKPVPIDPYNFAHPKRDEILVAIAGPGSNLVLAIILSIVWHFLPSQLLIILVYINVALAIFNLLPLPPLDGSKVFLNLMPIEKAVEWEEVFEKYGFFILAALLFLPINGSNIISTITSPVINIVLTLLLG